LLNGINSGTPPTVIASAARWLRYGRATGGTDDPNGLHRDDLSWLHFATLSEGAQLVRPSVDGGRPAPIDADSGAHNALTRATLRNAQ
jgi:hypothetical protein